MLRIRISEDPNNLAGYVSEIITRIRIRPSALKVFNTGIDEEKVLLNVGLSLLKGHCKVF